MRDPLSNHTPGDELGILQLLDGRRSTPSRLLGEPGPDPLQLRRMLRTALRVPDHGKLTPWRLLAIRGDARGRLGELLATRQRQRDPAASQAVIDKDRQRFSHAPLIITVISRITDTDRIPEPEQLLSGGCVCFSLLLAAHALGFGAQWLTSWAAYDAEIMQALGLQPGERVLGFIHIGTAQGEVPERTRPDPDALLQEWQG
jgi:nitroreductase